jgi:Aldehyde dehydrogenase family
VPDFDTALTEAADDHYGLAATVLTPNMAHAQEAWRALPVGTVKINAVFGGAPGGASEPRRASGSGFGFGPELLDEMTAMKVVHWSPPGGRAPSGDAATSPSKGIAGGGGGGTRGSLAHRPVWMFSARPGRQNGPQPLVTAFAKTNFLKTLSYVVGA